MMNTKNGLFSACARGDARRVAELLKKGASVNKRDGRYATPLIHTFCWRDSTQGHPEEKIKVAQLFLQAGADPNAQDNGRYTALMYATLGHDSQGVELLLRHGADVSLASTGWRAYSRGISAVWYARSLVMSGYVREEAWLVLSLIESAPTFPALGDGRLPEHWPEGYEDKRKGRRSI